MNWIENKPRGTWEHLRQGWWVFIQLASSGSVKSFRIQIRRVQFSGPLAWSAERPWSMGIDAVKKEALGHLDELMAKEEETT